MAEPVQRAKFPSPVDREAIAADWKHRGFSCQPFTDPPGREWNDFVHDTNELVSVLEGRLRLVMGGREHLLGPGDEAFIPKGSLHSVHNIHSGTTRWVFGYD
jgi:quercetin dioxygenase-like cupin family protein